MKELIRADQELTEEIPTLKEKIRKLEKTEAAHRQTEEALRRSEEKYRLLFDHSPLGLLYFDEESAIVACNDIFVQIIGSSREALIGLRMLNLPDKKIVSVIEKALNGSTGSYEGDYHSVTAKKITPVSVIFTPLIVEGGRILGGMGIIEDITERKRVEDALRESEEQSRMLFEHSVDIIFSIGLDYKIIYVSPSVENQLGYKPEEFIGRTVAELSIIMTPESVAQAINDISSVFSGNTIFTTENVFIAKDGSRKVAEMSSSPLIKGGVITGLISIARDVTERRRMEKKLLGSEEKFRTLAEFSPFAIAMTQGDRWIYANRAAEEISGYTEAELYRMYFWDFVHPDHRDMVKQSGLDRQQGKARPRAYEFKIIAKNGVEKWVSLTGNRILYEDKPTALVAIIDITERKMTEAVLLESEIKYRRIFESFEDLYYQTDENGLIRVLSPSLYRITGWSLEDLIGKPVTDVYVSPDEREKLLAEIARNGYLRDYEVLLKKKDGAYVCASLSAVILTGPDGKLNGIAGTLRDITERKRAEEEKAKLGAQLQQAQKMESVGRLAGGVAHDFNNMLGVILGHAELAMLRADLSPSLRDDLTEIRKAAERSSELTRQLLAFARKQTVAPKVLDMNETVSSMLNMLNRLIGEDIDLHWQPAADLWQVKMDPSQIDQILVNLCVNARDAISGVGKITIETANIELDAEYCAAHAGFIPGEYVCIVVSDNGCGMSKETLSHLFEPFFTTKVVGKGTGLGLATVYGVIKQNNGFINTYSEPGHGTTFTIYLSRNVDKTRQECSEAPVMAALRGHETILLAEDEPAILELTTTMLEMQGYVVLSAGTPGEALRLAREHKGDIHLLMTDVVMPEMNGRDLARNLLSLYPDIRRLFMSGYTANVIAHHGVLDKGVYFIQKPFTLKAMADKVREVLDSE